MATVQSPLRVALNKVYPASIYSRPAVAPLVLGVDGTTGQAQRNLTGMYKYTLEQMAISPFSVNSEEYMKRIREKYGYLDTGTYETMGMVGSVVGAGMGAVIGSGAWRGIHTDNFNVFKPKTWFEFQNPFQNPIKDGVPVGSKRQQTSAAFRTDNAGVRKFISDNKETIANYNKSVRGYNTTKSKLDRYIKKHGLGYLDNAVDKLQELEAAGSDLEKIKNAKETLKAYINNHKEVYDEYNKLKTEYINSTKVLDTNANAILTDANKISDDIIKEVSDRVYAEYNGLLKNANKQLKEKLQKEINEKISRELANSVSYKGATKIASEVTQHAAAKAAGTALGLLGTASDVVSLGLNVAGAARAFEEGDTINALLYAAGGIGDAVSIAGDVMQYTPLAPIGYALNWIGAAMSIAAGAIIGSRVGQTIGHSLTPEGATAQGLFAKNLYGSLIDRPLTSIATIVTTVGVPVVLNKLASGTLIKDKKGNTKLGVWKPIQVGSAWLTQNAWGNYVRSAVTMTATQGINALTTKLEDTWNPPEEAADVNFVTAFSVVGDLNDNLYGATARKATLLGLAKGESKAQTDALARAWGFSNEDIYYNPSFDDIREAAGIDLGNLGNSLLSTVGEILVDPQNLSEVAEKISIEKTAKKGASLGAQEINKTRIDIIAGREPNINNPAFKLLFDTTDKGIILKTLKYNTETKQYEIPSVENKTLENVKVYKDIDGTYKQLNTDNTIKELPDTIKDIYDKVDYDTTYLNSLNKQQLESELYKYYTSYLEQGAEGISKLYISQQTRFQTGSRYVAGTATDRLFVDNMINFIENVYKTNTSVDIITYKNYLKEQEKNDPNSFKEKFNALYKYYGAQNSGELLNSMISDFNIHLSEPSIQKLYTIHEGFRNQMNLIESVNNTINQLANPTLSLISASRDWLQDFITSHRNSTDVSKTAKMLIELDEISKGYTHIDIENAKKNIETFVQSFTPVTDKEFQEKIDTDERVQNTIKELEKFTNSTQPILDEIRQAKKDIEEFNKNKVYKDYTISDANNAKEVVTITKDNAKEIFEEIKRLNNKPVKTTAELKRLNAYTIAYMHYNYNGSINNLRVDFLNNTAEVVSSLNLLNAETTKVFINIIKELNKFTLITKGKTNLTSDDLDGLSFLNKKLAQLGIDKTIEFKNDVATLEPTANKLTRKQATKNNLRAYYTVDLPEYLCTLFNGELALKFGNKMPYEVGVNEIAIIENALKYTFDDWKHLDNSEKMAALKSVIATITNTTDATSYRSYLLSNEQGCLDSIIKRIDNAQAMTKDGKITISQPLSNVDISFLKRVVMHSLIEKPGYKQIFVGIVNKINEIKKALNASSKTLKDENLEFLDILKAYLNRTLDTTLKYNSMYDLLNSYIYTKTPTDTTLIALSSEYKKVFKYLDKHMISKLKKRKLSFAEIKEYHQKIATSQGVKALEEMYLTSDLIAEKNEQQQVTFDEESTDIQKGVVQDNEIDEFINRINTDNQRKHDLKKLRENIPFKLDNINPSQIFKAEYNIGNKYTHSNEKFTVIEMLNKLLEEGVATNAINNDGYLSITLRPNQFLDKNNKSHTFSKFIDDVESLPGYQYEVEQFVDEIVNLVFKSNGGLTIERKGKRYYIKDNKFYVATNKETHSATNLEIKNLKESLVKAYMFYGKGKHSSGITLKYDAKVNHKGFTFHNTAMYYKKKLFNTLIKNITIALRENTIVHIPQYDGKIPVYTTAKEYIKELHKYITRQKELGNDYEDYNKYAQDLYRNALIEVNENFSFDLGLSINKTLNKLLDRMYNFETNTINSRSINTPVIATDYVKRQMVKDEYFREVLKNFRDEKGKVNFIKVLRFLEDFMIETSSKSTTFKLKDFKPEIEVKQEATDNEPTYIFTHINGYKVTLFELMFEYHITMEQLHAFLNEISKNYKADQLPYLHTQVVNKYVEASEMFIKKTTKEEFVDMVRSQLDIEQKDYQQQLDDAEKAYDLLYGDLKARTLITELEYFNRKNTNDTLTQIKDFPKRFNKTLHKLYTDALNKYEKEYKHPDANCVTSEDYFLINILKWQPTKQDEIEMKKYLLSNIFFLDFKTAQGEFSEHHIELLAQRIEMYKEIQKTCTSDATKNYWSVQINSLEQYKKHCEEGQTPDIETKDEFINHLMDTKDYNEILKIFNNYTDIDNKELYMPVQIQQNPPLYKFVTVNTAQMLEQNKKGAGALNVYILSRFFDKFKEHAGKTADDVTEWTDNFGHALIVTDDITKENDNGNLVNDTSKINKIRNEYKLKHTGNKQLYIVTKQQFNELQEMFDKGEIVSYTVTTNNLKQELLSKYNKEPWNTVFIENRINVKSQVTVPAYMKDLQNVNKYLKNNNKTYKYLYNYVEAFNTYPMLLKSFLSEVPYTQTEDYERLKDDVDITEIFFEFIDEFGEAELDLNLLGEYFTDDYIKKGIEINTETPNMYELNKIQIGDTTAAEILKTAIKKLHDKYSNSDLKFNYDRVLNEGMVNKLFKLHNYALMFLNNASKAQEQGSLLMHYYNKMYDANLQELNTKFIQDEQNYNEDIWTSIAANKNLPDAITALAKDYKINHAKINDNYIKRSEMESEERNILRDSKLNFKTTHALIKAINELKDKQAFTIIPKGDNSFGIKYENKLFEQMFDNEHITKIITTLKRYNYNDTEIYDIIFKEIIYPFVQNIAVDFKISDERNLMFSLALNQNDARVALFFDNPTAYIHLKYKEELQKFEDLKATLKNPIDTEATIKQYENYLQELSHKLKFKIPDKYIDIQVRNYFVTLQQLKESTDINFIDRYAVRYPYAVLKQAYGEEGANKVHKVQAINDYINNASIGFDSLLDPLIESILDTKQIDTELYNYKKQHNIPEDINKIKQRTKINSTDYNYYEYKNNTLERSDVFVYKEGFSRKDQKNVITIADRIRNKINDTDIKNETNKFLNTLGNNLSKEFTVTKDSTMYIDSTTTFLETNNIKTINDLYQYYYRHSKHNNLSFEQYLQAISSYNAYKQYIHSVINKQNTEGTHAKWEQETNKFIQMFPGQNENDVVTSILQDIYNEIYPMSKYYADIFKTRKPKLQDFTSDSNMVYTINSNVLNISRNFFNKVKSTYLKEGMKVFKADDLNGDTIDRLQKLFVASETLSEFYKKVLNDNLLSNKRSFLYRILITMNHFKEQFKGSKQSWITYIHAVETKELADNVMDLQSLDFILGQGIDDGKHIATDVHRSFKGLQEVTRTVKAINKDLAKVVIDDTPSYVKTPEAKTIIYKENKFATTLRTLQNYITKPLFKSGEDTSLTVELAKKINREFQVENLDLIQEISAPSLEECYTTHVTYHSIRTLFTRVMKIIQQDQFEPHQFVRIVNVSEALNAFKDHTFNLGFYASQYELFTKDVQDTEALNKAIEKVEEYFRDNEHLITMSKTMVKGIIGYIYFTRYNHEEHSIKLNQFKEYVAKRVENHLSIEHKLTQDKIDKLYKIIHSTNLTTEERLNQAAAEIDEGKTFDELSDSDKEYIDILIKLGADESTLLTKQFNLFDTYEQNIKENINPEEFEQYIHTTNTIHIKRDKVDKNEKEIDKVNTSINSIQGFEHEIRTDGTNTKFKFTQANANKYINEIQNEVDNQKNKRTNKQQKLNEIKTALDLSRKNEILNFIKSDYCKSVLDANGAKYSEFMIETLKPIEESINDITKYLTDNSICTTEELNKYINAYIYTKTNTYNIIKQHRYNLDQQDVQTQIAIDLQTTDPSSYITTFKNNMDTLDEFEDKKFTNTAQKKLDILKENLSRQHTLNEKFNQYKNIDWKNITIKDEYEFSVASVIFYDFMRSISNSKRKIANEIFKEFKEAIKENRTVFATDNMVDTAIEYADKQIKKVLSGVQGAYETIQKYVPIFTGKDAVELITRDNNKVLITKTESQIKQELEIIETKIKETQENIDNKINFFDNNLPTLTQTKCDANFIKTYIKDEFVDLEKYKPTEIFKYVVEQSIKENKSLDEYLKVAIDDEVKYQYYKHSVDIYKKYKNDIDKQYKHITENTKQYNEQIQYKENVRNLTHSNDPRLEKIKQDLLSKYDQATIDGATDYLENKFNYDLYNTPEYKKVKDEIDQLSKDITHNEALVSQGRKYLKKFDTLEKLNKDKNNYEKELNTSLENVRASYERVRHLKTNTSNIKLYNKIYGPTTVTDIVDRAINDGFVTKKLVEDAGLIELHNPMVDCIITMYNYIYMKGWYNQNTKSIDKDKLEEFIIFDMETAKDLTNNNNRPYQLTLLVASKDSNGNLTINPITMYYSAYAFMDGTVDNPGPYLQQFIDQQTSIYKKEEPNITDEEILKRVQDIIDKVNSRENTLEKTMYLINTLSRSDKTIVAHNGNRFDFKNFNQFISSNVAHLIRDLYLQRIKNTEEIKTIKNAYKTNLITTEEFMNKLEAEKTKLIDMYKKGNIYSETALNQLESTLMLIDRETTNLVIKSELTQAYKDLRVFTKYNNDIDLYKDKYEPFEKLQKDFLKYYNEKDPAKKEQILKSICLEYEGKENEVKQLFEKTEKIIFTDSNKDESMIDKYTKKIIEQHKLPERYKGTINHKARLQAMLSEINSYEEMLNEMATSKDIQGVYSKYNKIKQEVVDDLNQVDMRLQQIQEEITKNNIAQEKINEHSNEIYGELYTAFAHIRNKTLTRVRDSKMNIRKYKDIYNSNKNLSTIDKESIEYNIKKAEKDMTDMFNSFVAIVDALEETKNKLGKDIRFEPSISTITTAKGKQKQLQIYDERTKQIDNYLNNLDKYWDDCWKDLQRSSKNIIKEMKQEFKVILDLIKKDIPEHLDFLNTLDIDKVTTKKDLQELRKNILNYAKHNETFKNYMEYEQHGQNLSIYYAHESAMYNYFVIQETQQPTLTEDNRKIATYLLNEEKTSIANSVIILQAQIIKEHNVAYEDISSYIKTVLDHYIADEQQVSQLLTKAMEQAMFHKTCGSIFKGDKTDTAEYKIYLQEFKKAASTFFVDPELKRQGIFRNYQDAKEGNDILGLTIDPEVVVHSDTDTTIRVSYNTDVYNELQTLIIPKDVNGKPKESSMWKVEFIYTYNEKGKDIEKPKTYKRTYKLDEAIKLYNEQKLFTSEGIYKNHLNREYMVFETDKDTNREAIERLMKFAKKLKEQNKVLDYIKKNTVYKSGLNINNLKIINLSERVRNQYAKHLALYNIAQTSDFKLADTSGIYKEVFKRVMGNLNALKYGQYLMRMPEEFGNDTILKILNDGVDKLSIELLKAAEANMGWSFSIKDEYSIEPMFGANTNSVRSILTSNLLYSTFTPIGFNNDIFLRAGKNNNLEDYIYDITTAEGLKKFEDAAEIKIKEEYDSSKQDVSYDTFKKERLNELKEYEQKRFNLFATNGKIQLSVFTPRVAQSNTHKKYAEDILHPLGVNLPVAFTTDTRAFEDDFLIDEDYAIALGWNEANKTWLKYGFKGAVKFIKGLSKTYNGAVIVGKAPSVQDRGSYGVYLEMAFNRILEHKLGMNLIKEAKGTPIDDIKIYKTQEEADATKDKDLIYIVGNKIVTEKSEIIDYAEFLDNLFTNKVDLKNKKTNTTTGINQGFKFVNILKQRIAKDSYYYVRDTVTGEMKKIIYNDPDDKVENNNRDIFFGTVYTLMDPEHTASHMQTVAQLKNKTDAELSYTSRDITGSVEQGGMESFVVDQSVSQKLGYNWMKGLIGAEEDKTTQQLADITFKLLTQGLRVFNSDKKATAQETVNYIITKYKLPSPYIPYLKEYYYCLFKYDPKSTTPENIIWEQRLNIAETRILNHAQSTWGGNKGLGYRTGYRRFWAARNQLLANTSLKTGEIKMAETSFNSLSKKGANEWIVKSQPYTKDTINKQLEEYAKEYNKDSLTIEIVNNEIKVYANNKDVTNGKYLAEIYRRLKYLGYLNDNFKINGKITTNIQGVERTLYIDSIKLKTGKFVQTSAYVKAIRSPVQDYAATPILKITGVTEHAAVEGNAAMYKIMGADNDGDTAAFLAVKHKEVTDGVLKRLDASTITNDISEIQNYADGYYDKDYLHNLNKGDLGISQMENSAESAVSFYKQALTNYAYIGKKTTSDTICTIKNGTVQYNKDDKGNIKSKGIRKGDAHYTWTEMLASASSDVREELEKAYEKYIQTNKIENDDIQKTLSSSEQDDMFWLESHIWIYSSKQTLPGEEGYDNNFYEDINQIKTYYDKYKDQIEQLKGMEYFLRHTAKGKEFLNKYRQDAINAAHYATLVRGHVSKVNVGITGGLRKDVNLGTLLSVFPNMNRTISSSKLSDIIKAQNKLWEEQYNIKDVTKLTVEMLANAVVSENIFNWELSKLQTFKTEFEKDKDTFKTTNESILKHTGSLDYDIILSTVIDAAIEYKMIEAILPELIKLTKKETVTNRDIYNVLKIEGKQNYLFDRMETLYKYLENNPDILDQETTEFNVYSVKTYYLSRFVNDFEKAVRNESETSTDKTNVIETYLNNYRNQFILTRVLSKILNDTIQVPISLSKHGASLGDYTKVHEELVSNAQLMAKTYAVNKIFAGPSIHHKRAILMGDEYNIFERKESKFKVSQKVKDKRIENANTSNKLQILDSNNLKSSLEKALRSIIKYDMFNGFITDTDEAIKHYAAFGKILSSNIYNHGQSKHLNLHKLLAKEISQLKNAIEYFEGHNIQIYKVINNTLQILSKIKEAKNYNEDVELPKEFTRLVGILLLKGINKKALQNEYSKSGKDILYIVNYLTEKDNPIADTISINEDATFDEDEISYSSIYDYEYTDKDNWTAAAENVQIPDYRYPIDQPDSTQLSNFIKDIAAIHPETLLTKEELLQEIISTIFRADAVRTNQLNKINNIKPNETESYAIQKILNENVTGYDLIKAHTDKGTQSYKKIQQTKKELKKLEKEKEALQNEKMQLEIIKHKLQQKKDSIYTSTPEVTEKLLKQGKEKIEQKYNERMQMAAKYAMLDNVAEVMYIVQNDKQKQRLKILDNNSVKHFKDSMLLKMDAYQHPFHILVNAFTRNGIVDWNKMYKYLKEQSNFIRITEVMPAENTEGLARQLVDYITVTDTDTYKVKREGIKKECTWDELTIAEQNKFIRKHNKKIKVKTWEDLQNLTKSSVKDLKYILNKKQYDVLGDDIKLEDFVTPTLKQIRIRSPKDLETIFNLIQTKQYTIGFTYLNDILSATETAYKPYKLEGKGAWIASAFNAFEKAILRFSSGFLLRNAMDVFNQLVSDMYLEKGLYYKPMQVEETLKYITYGFKINEMYNLISEERMFTLSEIMLAYKNIKKDIDTDANLNTMYRYLNSYIKQAEADDNPSNRIEARLKRAKEIVDNYNDNTKNKKVVADQMMSFLGNIKFAEYYKYFDTKIINGKPILGLRIDADADTKRAGADKVSQIISQKDDMFDKLLIEVSAFMQTNAMLDMFKEKQYHDLFLMVDNTKYELTHDTRDKTINEIEKEIEATRKQAEASIGAKISNKLTAGYDELTANTENMARILGFILNRNIYGKTFDDSVQNSLKMWFNYGQRSPLEIQLMYDIPYISYPIRSILNWSSRLLDPRYAKLMDDIIDGVYGQYADEDGQYSEYEQFMIKNGWIPITNKLGIRAGSGAFDIYNIMSDPAGQIEQRRSPILRGLQTLIETGDLAQSAKQLAAVGAVNKFAQAATLGSYNANKGTMGQPSLGKTFSMFFEYNQYTPKKYSYLYNSNGRYKYYENIYKNWFNKYGRMRKPTVDPVQLVKNIKWQQFVRRMQHKYRR